MIDCLYLFLLQRKDYTTWIKDQISGKKDDIKFSGSMQIMAQIFSFKAQIPGIAILKLFALTIQLFQPSTIKSTTIWKTYYSFYNVLVGVAEQ